MKQKIHVFIISLQGSKRVKKLIKQLRKFKIQFKVIQAIDGKKLVYNKKITKFSNKKIIKKNIDRNLSPPEIGAAASHLKVYKYILKKKIDQAVILEDDAYPSKEFKTWIKEAPKVKDYTIVSFFSWPSNGYIYKKKIDISKLFKIYKAKTHLFSSGSYQINRKTCLEILKITKGKVIAYVDWPFFMKTSKINLALTVPFLFMMDDEGISYLKEKQKKNQLEKYNTVLYNKILEFFRIPYYIFFIPFIFGRYKNLDHYIEHFFYKYLLKFKNAIYKTDVSVKDIFYNINSYYPDLRRKVSLFLEKKNF